MTINERIFMDFCNRRDERNEIILERLEWPEKATESMDNGDQRVDFVCNGKSYWYHRGQHMAIQSYEFFPNFKEARIILGVPFRLGGIDYKFSPFRRRVTWDLWSGALTENQAETLWGVATMSAKPHDPWQGWEENGKSGSEVRLAVASEFKK